jgi:hypothetical protein
LLDGATLFRELPARRVVAFSVLAFSVFVANDVCLVVAFLGTVRSGMLRTSRSGFSMISGM